MNMEANKEHETEEARKIIFDYYLSGVMFSLIYKIKFTKEYQANKERREEFLHFLLDRVLNKADTAPDEVIRLHNEKKLTYWIVGVIRNQLFNEYSLWSRMTKHKNMVFVGQYGILENIYTTDHEHGEKTNYPIEYYLSWQESLEL